MATGRCSPLYFGPIGQWLLALLTGSSRPPQETLRATADILAAFLGGTSIDEAIDAYDGIVETK